MSLERLDPLLSKPKKLAAVGILANAREVEFAFIRDQLNLSDSDLSKQMSALVAAGYATVKKVGAGGDRKTWYMATKEGAAALQSHVSALNSLISGSAD